VCPMKMMMDKKKMAAVVFALFAIMLAGLLFSRAVLSVSMGVWALLILVQCKQFTRAVKQPIFWWSLAPVCLFFTGAWQQPFAVANYDYLLTLLVYPVASLAAVLYKFDEDSHLKNVWLFAVIISLAYPVGWTLFHFAEVKSTYAQGGSLPTFMDTDHVRYGIFLCTGLLLVVSSNHLSKKYTVLIACCLVFFIIAMAIRTAWVGLFIIVLFTAFSNQQRYMQRMAKLLLITIIPLSILGYSFVPSIRQKINYTAYDYRSFDKQVYDPNYSDGARRIINNVAWKSIREDEGSAVGWAAIPGSLQRSFAKRYEGKQLSYGWPFNQWLFWWMGSGFIGTILFTAWLLFPVYYGLKNKNAAVACWSIVIAATCLVESTLSLQFGVFLHVWPLVLLWRQKPVVSDVKTL
jgi:O-antigen ligase